jgi:hypothetical protein
MNAIKSKALFAGLSMFAFTAIHAQDTTTTPKPDTTKPKTDTTVMIKSVQLNSEKTATLNPSFVMINDNKAVAKLEAIDNKKVS